MNDKSLLVVRGNEALQSAPKVLFGPTENLRHPVLILWPYAVNRIVLKPAFCVGLIVCDVILVALSHSLDEGFSVCHLPTLL